MQYTKILLIAFLYIAAYVGVSAQENTVELKNTAVANVTLGVTEVSLIRINAQVIALQLQQQDAGMAIETSKSDSSALYISLL